MVNLGNLETAWGLVSWMMKACLSGFLEAQLLLKCCSENQIGFILMTQML